MPDKKRIHSYAVGALVSITIDGSQRLGIITQHFRGYLNNHPGVPTYAFRFFILFPEEGRDKSAWIHEDQITGYVPFSAPKGPEYEL